MNAEGTPTRAGKGISMSASLKERLKRCGRYHVGSPAAAPQKRQALPPTHLLKSFSPPGSETKTSCHSSSSFESLHKRNPAKRKVDLCTGQEGSELVATNNTLCTHDSPLPGKRKAIDDSSEFDRGEFEIPPAEHNLVVRTVQNSLRTCSQQKSCDLQCRDTGVSKARGCAVNCMLKSTTRSGACDPPVQIYCTSNDAKHQPSKSRCDSENRDSLNSQLQSLDSALKEKLELLRKLKMVKMYREKNDLTELQKLIDRWRSVSQAALTDLLSLHPEPRPTLGDLISHLQIDPALVQYDAEEQDFL